MTWQLTETPGRALATYIEDSMAVKLAAVAARSEYAGAIAQSLPVFVAIRHHEPPDNPEAAYPVLYMRPLRSRLTPATGGFRRGFLGQHEYMIAVICVSTDGPDLALAMAERYILAVAEMIAEYFSAADSRTTEWAMVSPVEINYEPLWTRDSGEFFADVRMIISAIIDEGAIA